MIAAAVAFAGCEREPQPVEPLSNGDRSPSARETPTAEEKKQPQQTFTGDSWEEVLAAARAAREPCAPMPRLSEG